MLIAVNIIFIPSYGYMACAWGGVAGYGTAMILSYLVGRKKYPIDYDIKGMGMYVVLTLVLFCIMTVVPWPNSILQVFCNTCLILLYMYVVLKKDMPHDTISRFTSHIILRR
jgi:O-antigen/teichoic acid export membrane protein